MTGTFITGSISSILTDYQFNNQSVYAFFLNRNWELTAPWTGAKISVPVKFIVGDQDLTYNSPGAKEYINGGGFKKDVPLLDETVVLKGVGHFLHEESPEEINQHIHGFFQKFL